MRTKILPIALALVALGCSSPGPDTDPVHAPLGVATAIEAPVASAASSTEKVARRDVALVVHASGRSWVVLDAAPDPTWEAGAPALVGDDVEGTVAVARTVDASKVSAVAKESVGRRVRLLGRHGVACEATIDGLAILGRVAPDGDVYARWRGEARDEADRPLPAPPKSDIANEAWDLAEGARTLVGSLGSMSGRCDEATFAVAQLGQVVIHPREASDETRRAALLAFRALPEHQSHARDYAEEADDTLSGVPWDSRDEAMPVVETLAQGDQELVWVSAGAGGGCGDFSAQLSALFRKTPRGLEVVRVLDGWALELSAVVVHAERGERPATDAYELMFPEARTRATEGEDVERLNVAAFGCAC